MMGAMQWVCGATIAVSSFTCPEASVLTARESSGVGGSVEHHQQKSFPFPANLLSENLLCPVYRQRVISN